LEDLNKMQESLHHSVQPLLEMRITEAGGTKEDANALLKEIDSRFERMSKPCVEAVSRKVQQKI
jgi:hypothetical protein